MLYIVLPKNRQADHAVDFKGEGDGALEITIPMRVQPWCKARLSSLTRSEGDAHLTGHPLGGEVLSKVRIVTQRGGDTFLADEGDLGAQNSPVPPDLPAIHSLLAFYD